MNKKSILLTLIILMGLSSCEKRLDFEEDQLDPAMVIYAFPRPSGALDVRVSTSRSVLEGRIESDTELSSCTVSLSQGGVTLASTDENPYLLEAPLLEGETYDIMISHPSYPSVHATTSIPGAITDLTATNLGEDDGVEIDITFMDVPNADYYQLLIYEENIEEDVIRGWRTSSEYFEIDAFEGENYYYDYAFFTDDFFENGMAELRITLDEYSSSVVDLENVNVLLRSCSEDYYLFYRSRNAFYNSDVGLFSEPVQIHTNIENGLGVFGGYTDVVTAIQ